MKWNAFCILAITAICILISPALSQSGGQPGNMNGDGVGPNQGSFIPDQAQGIQDGGQPQGQADDPKRFMGCNTWPQKMENKKPNDNLLAGLPDEFAGTPSHNPDQELEDKKPLGAEGKDNGPGPWVYKGAGPQETRDLNPGDEGFGKPFMGDRDRLKPLMDEHRPEMPPKKSIMPKTHKKMPRDLMDDHLPKLPPMKPIKNFQG